MEDNSVHKTQQKRFIYTLLIGIILAIVLFYYSLTSGTYALTFNETLRTLFFIDQDPQQQLVIFTFRLPRIILGLLVGLALGVVGGVLQAITKNELADPGILGIQSAVGFVVVCYLLFVQQSAVEQSTGGLFSMSTWGWIGGIVACLLLFSLATQQGTLDPKRLILVGIALNSGFSALTLFTSLKMNPSDFEMATVWLSGSIYSASWEQVISVLVWVVIIVPFFFVFAPILNVLQFHETTIKSFGVNANLTRFLFLLGAVGLISASVMVSGAIVFVGLLAPHIARKLVGSNYAYVLPISGIVGMNLVVLGDLIGRTIFAPAELPVGIVISIIGVPCFIYQLLRKNKELGR